MVWVQKDVERGEEKDYLRVCREKKMPWGQTIHLLKVSGGVCGGDALLSLLFHLLSEKIDWWWCFDGS